MLATMQKAVAADVERRFIHLPAAERAKIRARELNRLIADQNSPQAQAVLKRQSRSFLEYEKDASKYLMEVDSYYYLSLTKKLIETGHIYGTIKGGKYFNPKMLAPSGFWYPADLHPYMGFVVYKILAAALPHITLMSAVKSLGLLLIGLCVIAVLFLFSRVMGLSPLAASVTGSYLMLMPIFLRRSLYGWYDTDIYNILFPLLIYGGLFLALMSDTHRSQAYRRGVFIALLSTIAHAFFWRGWLITFSVAASGLFVSCLILRRHRRLVAHFIVPVLIFIGLSGLWRDGWNFISDFFKPRFSIWPDVFLIVGELSPTTWASFLKETGHPALLGIAALGGIGGLIRAWRVKSRPASHLPLFLLLTIVFYTGVALRYERFLLLLVVPMAVAFGMGLHRLLNLRFRALRLFGAVVAAAGLIVIFWNAHETAKFEHPIYNTTWHKMMEDIRLRTPEDSIIASWWSPGHFITGMAERSVFFDGATQNTPQAYWIARFFLESSEDRAAGILRMLAASGNGAVEFLTQKGFPVSQAVKIIEPLLTAARSEAETLLRPILTESDAAHLLDLIQGDGTSTDVYVMVYDNMIKQAIAMEYIGFWDFDKAETFRDRYQASPSDFPRGILRRGSQSYTQLMWLLSTGNGPLPDAGESYLEREDSARLYFPNGLTVDKNFKSAHLNHPVYGSGSPKALFALSEKGLIRFPQQGNLNISALVVPDPARTRAYMADSRLLQSMAFRLYYMDGVGLQRFTPVSMREDARDRTRIVLYKANTAVNGGKRDS